jgi:hypothetical protein
VNLRTLKAGVFYFALVFGAGFALGLLFTAEFTLVLGVRGITASEYFATLDPVSGTVYHVLLGVFAVMPLLVARK